MDWEFSADQVIEGEYEISLTDFTKKLYSKTTELAAMSLDAGFGEENSIDKTLTLWRITEYSFLYVIIIFYYAWLPEEQ